MGRITTTTYDNRGWVATETDPLGNVVTYSYTATGKAATVTDPSHSGGGSSRIVYLRQGRPPDRGDRRQWQHHQSYGLRRRGQPDQRDRC